MLSWVFWIIWKYVFLLPQAQDNFLAEKNHILHVQIPFSSFPMHRVILDTGKAGSIITYFTASYFWRDNYPGQSFQLLVQKEVYIFCSCVGVDNAIVQNAFQEKYSSLNISKSILEYIQLFVLRFSRCVFEKWNLSLTQTNLRCRKFNFEWNVCHKSAEVFVHRICELIKAR